jgi:hypothetical protein
MNGVQNLEKFEISGKYVAHFCGGEVYRLLVSKNRNHPAGYNHIDFDNPLSKQVDKCLSDFFTRNPKLTYLGHYVEEIFEKYDDGRFYRSEAARLDIPTGDLYVYCVLATKEIDVNSYSR